MACYLLVRCCLCGVACAVLLVRCCLCALNALTLKLVRVKPPGGVLGHKCRDSYAGARWRRVALYCGCRSAMRRCAEC